MTCALIKLSYNRIGDNDVVGGICGAGFFIYKDTCITAHHIFNSYNMKPNMGFRYCQYWMVTRDGQVFELDDDVSIDNHPEVDSTVIHFNKKGADKVFGNDRTLPKVSDKIHNEGYFPGMPIINSGWREDKLVITYANTKNNISDGRGKISKIDKATLKSKDVNFYNKTLILTSYPGNVGMSGGPLLNENNQVIGLMSIGLPPDVPNKTSIGAIWIDEILNCI